MAWRNTQANVFSASRVVKYYRYDPHYAVHFD